MKKMERARMTRTLLKIQRQPIETWAAIDRLATSEITVAAFAQRMQTMPGGINSDHIETLTRAITWLTRLREQITPYVISCTGPGRRHPRCPTTDCSSRDGDGFASGETGWR